MLDDAHDEGEETATLTVTGAGMDVGGGLAFTDAVTGLSLDVRVRTLVVHQAEAPTAGCRCRWGGTRPCRARWG